ncbi:hypothetical protein RIR_jg24575.t1 [Rhizophagus irregularis DAOM 181602=DAOM 197198]|uniref:Uncharacterized protein n=1 Tax=Rhizophagus irregularis (strain DAOM 181602 / DAOM 197198 / MUCL 43194) TaxID=747089 RepID=U9T670_RHIID|nr:hypothetical protein RIR_jg24575.t1 [Rhizophagus irregularis DAOM 181602=DAOM 197198]
MFMSLSGKSKNEVEIDPNRDFMMVQVFVGCIANSTIVLTPLIRDELVMAFTIVQNSIQNLLLNLKIKDETKTLIYIMLSHMFVFELFYISNIVLKATSKKKKNLRIVTGSKFKRILGKNWTIN